VRAGAQARHGRCCWFSVRADEPPHVPPNVARTDLLGDAPEPDHRALDVVESDAVIVEVLPASIARSLGSDGGYKGRSQRALAGRVALTAAIERLVALQEMQREQLVADIEGDAIDAVLAGLAALRAYRQGFAAPPRPVFDEGWIY
jgi:hypothetical protein